jgi:hypothetical protein
VYIATFIALSLVLLLLLGGIALMLLAIADMRREQRLVQALQSASSAEPPRFDLAQIAHLPPPVQRYFKHAIAPDTPLVRNAIFSMQGRIKLGQDDWWPYTAQQLLVPGQGYLWSAVARKGWWRISGSDSLHAGQGRMRWNMLGWLPVVRAASADVARSAAGRLALEAVLCPGSLLGPTVRWEAPTPDSITTHFEIDGRAIAIGLVLAKDGAVVQVRGLRWGPTRSAQYAELLFGINVEREASAAGYTIPGVFKAGWELDGGPEQNLFFEAELLKAQWF